MSRYCTECGTAIFDDGVKFCPNCGSRISTAPANISPGRFSRPRSFFEWLGILFASIVGLFFLLVVVSIIFHPASHPARISDSQTPVPTATIAPMTTTIRSWTVAPYSIGIHPIGDRHNGDIFSITGTTDLPAGGKLLVRIYPSSGTPDNPVTSSTVMVTKGITGFSEWHYDVDTSELSFRPGPYTVKVTVTGNSAGGTATTQFDIVQ